MTEIKFQIIENSPVESTGYLNDYMNSRNYKFIIRRAWENNTISSFQEDDAEFIIILGSPESVNNSNSFWIKDLKEYINNQIKRGKYILGICFGAQLLATLLGGSVEKMPRPRIEHRFMQAPEIPYLSGTWVCLHEEHIIPTSEMNVMMRDEEVVYAFSKDRALGLQFHPEIDIPSINNILNSGIMPKEIDGKLEKIIQSFDKERMKNSYQLLDEIFQCFIKKEIIYE